MTKAGLPPEKYLLRGWWCVVQRRLIRLCEGEPSAARLYKPARLCDSRTPCTPHARPHPRDVGSHPVADSPPKHSRPIKRTRVPRSRRSLLLLSPEATRPPSNANSNLAAKCRRGSLRFLGMGVFHRCLPLKTSAREKSSLDRLSDWRRFAGKMPMERQMDPIVRRGGDRYFFFRDIMRAERKKYLLHSISFAYRKKKRERKNCGT